MNDTEWGPSYLTEEEVDSEFRKAFRQMEYLHLRALINQRADKHFVVDDGWKVDKGELSIGDMHLLRYDILRNMRGE